MLQPTDAAMRFPSVQHTGMRAKRPACVARSREQLPEALFELSSAQTAADGGRDDCDDPADAARGVGGGWRARRRAIK